MMEMKLQLHSGGGRGQKILQSAPGSSGVAAIDGAGKETRADMRDKLLNKKGRNWTLRSGVEALFANSNEKKNLLGE